jgi:hypothetical protein
VKGASVRGGEVRSGQPAQRWTIRAIVDKALARLSDGSRCNPCALGLAANPARPAVANALFRAFYKVRSERRLDYNLLFRWSGSSRSSWQVRQTPWNPSIRSSSARLAVRCRAMPGTAVDAYVSTLRSFGYRIFEREEGGPTTKIRDTACRDQANPCNVLVHDDVAPMLGSGTVGLPDAVDRCRRRRDRLEASP